MLTDKLHKGCFGTVQEVVTYVQDDVISAFEDQTDSTFAQVVFQDDYGKMYPELFAKWFREAHVDPEARITFENQKAYQDFINTGNHLKVVDEIDNRYDRIKDFLLLIQGREDQFKGKSISWLFAKYSFLSNHYGVVRMLLYTKKPLSWMSPVNKENIQMMIDACNRANAESKPNTSSIDKHVAELFENRD